jgi:hypothetical protein
MSRKDYYYNLDHYLRSTSILEVICYRGKIVIKSVSTDHPLNSKTLAVMTGGRCSEVIYVIKVQNGTSTQWPL